VCLCVLGWGVLGWGGGGVAVLRRPAHCCRVDGLTRTAATVSDLQQKCWEHEHALKQLTAAGLVWSVHCLFPAPLCESVSVCVCV
jgi:hypothetical protein